MSVFENNVFERGNLAVIVTHSISNLGESNSRDNYQIHIITDPEQSGYSLDELHDYFSLEGHRIISYDQLTLYRDGHYLQSSFSFPRDELF